MPANRVLIVRHGETDENVLGIVQGQLDTKLNAHGAAQARRTGYALRQENVTKIICSPLQRAVATGIEIAKHHAAAPHETDARLKERCFGVLQGQVYRGPATKPEETEGIESSKAMAQRLEHFWRDLVASLAGRDGEVIVLVSHGGAISTLVNHVIVPQGHATPAPHVRPSRFWNCSISELVIPTNDEGGSIVRWSDIAHLAEANGKHVENVDEVVA
ncbi:phosphoglycerate mutase (2,3-diphosphoglycerate-independent) [Malassezia sp. CBS 17886]|nr:phosphoglycerate mutase (2,3-diphosphoglycerate-independent) [Malassezia sp. CBS 17886]